MKKHAEFFLACLTFASLLNNSFIYADEVQVPSDQVQASVEVIVETKNEEPMQEQAQAAPLVESQTTQEQSLAEATVESSPALVQENVAQAENSQTPTENPQNTAPEKFVSTYERLKGKEITPSYGPVVGGGADVYFEASYLYWYMSELGLELVGTNYEENALFFPELVGSDSMMPSGRVITPGNKASSGFKVGVGVDFDYDGWDLGAVYTWYRNHHQNSLAQDLNPEIVTNVGSLFVNYPFMSDVGGELLLFKGSQKLKLNIVDWTLARSFYVSPKLSLRPSLGLKTTWGHQYFDIVQVLANSDVSALYPLSGGNFSTSAGQTRGSFYNHQSNWGLGTRMALDTEWMFTKCFSLFGECAVTALWQYMKTSRIDVYDAVTGTLSDPTGTLLSDYTDVNYHQVFHTVNPVLETQIGLRYDHLFSNDCYRIRAEIGWECQVWFNQNAFLTQYGQNQAYQNLALQGLTVNFRFDF